MQTDNYLNSTYFPRGTTSMGLTWAGREASQTVCTITRTPQTLALVAGIASGRSSATLVPPGRKAASQPHQLHPRDRLPNLQVDASFSPNPCPERPECINYMVLDDPTRKVKYTTDIWCCDSQDTAREEHCDDDDWKGLGWYRIGGQAGSRMPSSAPGNPM